MIWQDYAKQLKEVLALEGSPVGVTFSDTPASNGKENRIMPCTAFYQAARKGATFNIFCFKMEQEGTENVPIINKK